MKKSTIILSALIFAVTTANCAWAQRAFPHSIGKHQWKIKDYNKIFATLPDGIAYPEGITTDPTSGDVYVSTFSFSGNNTLLRYNKWGKLLAQIDFAATPLLGLAFNPADNKVYICNTGDLVGDQSRIQRVDADFEASSEVEDVAAIPHINAPEYSRFVGNPDGSEDEIIFGNNAAAPNAMVFDSSGNLYFSDSFQGAIFQIPGVASAELPAEVTTVAHDALLATAGFPPFGANGLAIKEETHTLFVANTGDDRILTLNLETGDIAVFAESINGADGIALDDDGYLLVAANQADAIKVLDENGRVIRSVGSFNGITSGGRPKGLLFPASLAISGNSLYVTNLSLPLTDAAGDEPEEDVTLHTVIKFPFFNR